VVSRAVAEEGEEVRGRRGDDAEREETLLQDSHQKRKKMIMIVKTPGSQVWLPSSRRRRKRGEKRGEG